MHSSTLSQRGKSAIAIALALAVSSLLLTSFTLDEDYWNSPHMPANVEQTNRQLLEVEEDSFNDQKSFLRASSPSHPSFLSRIFGLRPASSQPISSPRFLYYYNHNGWSNQLVSLAHAAQIAYETNRILILPPILEHEERIVGQKGAGPRCQKWLMPEVFEYAALDARKCKTNSEKHVSFKEIMDTSQLSKSTGVQFVDLCDFVASEPKLAAEYFFQQQQRQSLPEIIDLDGECTLGQTRSYPEMIDHFNSIFGDQDVALIPSVFTSKNRNSQSKTFLQNVLSFHPSSKMMALQQIILNHIGQPYVSAHVRYDDRFRRRCSSEPKLLDWVRQEQESLNMNMPHPPVYFASSSQTSTVCNRQFFEHAGLQAFTLSDLLVKEDVSQMLSSIKVPKEIMYLILDQLLVSLGEKVILNNKMPQFSTFHMVVRVRHSRMFPDEPPPRQGSFMGNGTPLLGKDFYFGM